MCTATLGFDLDTLAVEEAWDSGKKETIARWTDGYKITVKQTIETTPTAVQGVDVSNNWNFGTCFAKFGQADGMYCFGYFSTVDETGLATEDSRLVKWVPAFVNTFKL